MTPRNGFQRAVWSGLGIKATWRRGYSFRIRAKSVGFVENKYGDRHFKEGARLIVGTVDFEVTLSEEVTIDVPWQRSPLFRSTETSVGAAQVMLWLSPLGQTHATAELPSGHSVGCGFPKPKNGKPYFTITEVEDSQEKVGMGWASAEASRSK